MQLEVWTKRPFRAPKHKGNSLILFINKGRGYATWKNSPLAARSTRRLGVDAALAVKVLGAQVESCPYVGAKPTLSWYKAGYCCRAVTSGEDVITYLHCTECGFTSTRDGNPRFMQAMTGSPSESTHPHTTRLVAPDEFASFAEAGWDAASNMLTAESGSGRLIVWVHGLFSSPAQATTAFPRAMASEQSACTILCESTDDPARAKDATPS